MLKKNSYIPLSLILIFLSLFSFFLGFYFDENSAGGGTYLGDWVFAWKNLQLFVNHEVLFAINHESYLTNRPPLLYILHAKLNPFVESEINYRRTVFIISLTIPILFYMCLKQKFKKEDNFLLLLVASTIFLSPYYRTSSYWGLEENYGLISLLLTFLFFHSFIKNENHHGYKIYLQLFFTIFFSSVCIYFDQKLLIIPIICFFSIILSKKIFKIKLFSILFYFILSLPYIYLISLWGGIFPSNLTQARNLGNQLYLDHFGYTTTIVAFYIMPLLLFKGKSLFNLIKSFFSEKSNYYFVVLFFAYIAYLIILRYFFNIDSLNIDVSVGKGFIHKSALILFKYNFFRELFLYFAFLISWIIILIFINKSIKDSLILLYFFLLSIVTLPLMQEYFDPLILIMLFTFFSSKLIINYKNVTILFLYFAIFLISSNIYYHNLLS